MKNDEKIKTQKKPSRRKYVIAVCIIVLLIIAGLVFSLLQEPKLEPDPASEVLIRQVASKMLHKDTNDMTDEDFAQIKSFTLGEHMYASVANPIELCDIKLLEKFTGMEWLYLGRISYPRDKISKCMIVLAKFGVIDLKEKFVLDLRPLENLDNLRTLNIFNTPIKSIKPLSSLTNLQSLFIINSKINSVEALKNSVNLQELIINGSEISDLRPLTGLKNLKRLNIKDCKNIKDKQVEDLQKALPYLQIQR